MLNILILSGQSIKVVLIQAKSILDSPLLESRVEERFIHDDFQFEERLQASPDSFVLDLSWIRCELTHDRIRSDSIQAFLHALGCPLTACTLYACNRLLGGVVAG